MAYRFKPIHVPGKMHVVPDTMSRRSHSPIAQLPKRQPTPMPDNNVLPGYKEVLAPPDWVSLPVLSSIISNDDSAKETDDPNCLLLDTALANIATLSQREAHIGSIQNEENIRVLTWDRLNEACQSCPIYRRLHQVVSNGTPDSIKDWEIQLQPFHQHRH